MTCLQNTIATHVAASPTVPLYLYIAPQNVHLGCGAKKKTEGIQAPCETVNLSSSAACSPATGRWAAAAARQSM